MNSTALYGGRDLSREYAETLLADLDLPVTALSDRAGRHPAVSWADSGAMQLTGRPGGSPRICPVALANCAEGVVMALATLTGSNVFHEFEAGRLLGERAAIFGFARNGPISPGGSCRFLRGSDGWIAINLARDEDWQLLSAWLERDIAPAWPALDAAVRDYEINELVGRGRLLGMAIALHQSPASTESWYEILQEGPRAAVGRRESPLVVDLSSLWAGPLCGHLLQMVGARVIKVESTRRPDGARNGPAAFHDLLNGGKQSVALDFSTMQDRTTLRTILRHADIVLESSRPRALRQLGIIAEEIVAETAGLTWLSVTGHGRNGERADWAAFGDDAAVAAGLSALLPTEKGAPIFCGDAIGDPLTGLHAALAAWARWKSGSGGLVSVALSAVVGHCIAFDHPGSMEGIVAREREGQLLLRRSGISAAPPVARRPIASAQPFGADTTAVSKEFGTC